MNKLLLLHYTIHAKFHTPLLTINNFTQQIKLITSMKFSFEFLYLFGPTHSRKIETEMILAALTTSLLLVLTNFINRWFTTKSRDDRSDLSGGQASKPYSKIAIHLVFINCKK